MKEKITSGGAQGPLLTQFLSEAKKAGITHLVAQPLPQHAQPVADALERLRAQINWLRNGKLLDGVPMMTVMDMETLEAALAASQPVAAPSSGEQS